MLTALLLALGGGKCLFSNRLGQTSIVEEKLVRVFLPALPVVWTPEQWGQ